MGLSWATTHNSEPQSPFKLTINFNVTVNKKVIIVNLQFNLPVASLPHHFLRPHDHISILVLDTHVLWLITLTMLIHTLFHASIPHLFIPWIQLIANIRPNKHFSLASLHFCLIFLLIFCLFHVILRTFKLLIILYIRSWLLDLSETLMFKLIFFQTHLVDTFP